MAMGQRSLVDVDALREAEQVFASTEEVAIAAFNVLKIKQQGESTGTQLLKALGAKTFLAREAPQPRLLCFTVRRSKQTKGFKPSFQVCKPPDGRGPEQRKAAYSAVLQASVTKSYPFKSINEVGIPSSRYDTAAGHTGLVLELRFSSTSSTAGSSYARSDIINQFKFGSSEELQLVLAIIVQLLRQHDIRMPKFSGVDVQHVNTWWQAHQAQVLPALGGFATAVLVPGSSGEVGGEGEVVGGGGPRVLLSTKEERELEELLDMFAMGIGDVAEFEQRLAQEHEALEAANVMTMMTSLPMAESVVGQIKKTLALLEDLDENLLVFDTKLRHMREDIAAIETSNNTLELQSRNNTKLLRTLQGLLSDVRLPDEALALLENPPFGRDSKLPAITGAAWQLVAKLRRLDPGAQGCLSESLLSMRVVQDAREALSSLSGRFVARALQHLRAACNTAVDEVKAELSSVTDRTAKLRPPSHERLRSMASRHSDLVLVLAALDPACLERVQAAYSEGVNMLVRKELRITVAELKKAATLEMQANPVDYNLTASASKDAAANVGGSGPGPGGTGSIAGGASVLGSSEDNDEMRSLASGPSHAAYGSVAGGGGPKSTLSRHSRSTFRSIMSRGKGTYDPFNMAIPLQDAYQGLLEAYLPHLLAEVEAAANFLLLYQGAAEAAASMQPADMVLLAAPAKGRKKGRRRRGTGADSDDVAASGDGAGPAGGGAGAVASGSGGAGRPLSAQGRQVLEVLLRGVDEEFLELPKLARKNHQVLCLPMMALTSACCAALRPRPVAFGLARALAACHAALHGLFAEFVAKQQEAVEAYGARLAAQGGVKQRHVLNFIMQFALMAHHMEQSLLTSNADELIAALTGGQGVQQQGAEGAGAAGLQQQQGAAGRGGADAGGPPVAGAGEADAEAAREAKEAEAIRDTATWQVRPDVDAVYAGLVGLMFQALEKVAASDPKHGDRLRAENYAYFVEAVRPLVRHGTALEPYMLQAEAKQEECIQAYVEAQLRYTSLYKVLELSERIDKLLEVVGPSEVAYQAGCSQAEARALVASNMKDADKKIGRMYNRVKKHLGNSNLAFRVWERVYEQIVSRYARLEEQCALCYPSLVLSPSLDEVEDVFKGVGPGGEAA